MNLETLFFILFPESMLWDESVIPGGNWRLLNVVVFFLLIC